MYGAVPPVAVTVTVPSEPPKHLTGVWLKVTTNPALKDRLIGVTKSSNPALGLVETFVFTKTFWTAIPTQGSIAAVIRADTSIEISTN